MSNIQTFAVPLVVTLNIEDWADEYDIPDYAVTDDVASLIQQHAHQWLTEQLGHKTAQVRLA